MRGKVKDALKCPFCGTTPTIEPCYGGGPDNHIIGCSSRRCDVTPCVVGESAKEAIEKWNNRR